MNFLEQLVSEWYEFQGYFVRRNVRVGVRANGGYEGELDVVALHPGEKRLLHIEPSMDADSWQKRELRFAAKFAIGQKYIPTLFAVGTLMEEIRADLKTRRLARAAVREQYFLLRALQFAAHYWHSGSG